MRTEQIILGLVSHEPHFTLLREEVKFGGRNQKGGGGKQTFHLFSLKLFREYLHLEFSQLQVATVYGVFVVFIWWLVRFFVVGVFTFVLVVFWGVSF
jgi:5'-3' exoribonuclease 1